MEERIIEEMKRAIIQLTAEIRKLTEAIKELHEKQED